MNANTYKRACEAIRKMRVSALSTTSAWPVLRSSSLRYKSNLPLVGHSLFVSSNERYKRLVRLRNFRKPTSARYFASKRRGNKDDNAAKKKKYFFSQRPDKVVAPEPGIVLPYEGIQFNEASLEENKRIVNNSTEAQFHVEKSRLFSPIVDHGLQNNGSSEDKLSSESLDGINLSLSHQTMNSAPSMIDLASMYDPKIHLPLKPDFADPGKNYETATPLGDELMKYIGVVGAPITLAEYMKRCLRDENYGYYTNPPTDKDDPFVSGDDDIGIDSAHKGRGHRLIGQAGDFTTAPEISQIFGECLCIWLLTQYEALGRPSRIQLVELGPGRGTLMSDILRSASGIKGPGEDFINALMGGSNNGKGQVNGVHFVEISENLRITQREALQTLENNTDSTSLAFNFVRWKTQDEKMVDMKEITSKLREMKAGGEKVDEDSIAELMRSKQEQQYRYIPNDGELSTIPIHWHDSFDSVPHHNDSDGKPTPTFIIGQEFLDALPVHVFQKTEHGWREHMVDVAIDGEEDDDKKKVEVQMRDGTTATTSALTSSRSKINSTKDEKKKPRFRHVLSPGITPALRNLLHVDEDGKAIGTTSQCALLNEAPIGTVIEVCPEALAIFQDFALRIEKCRGAALMIDYGNEGSKDSVRAFRKHEQVDVLSSPGTNDITADVDFEALRNSVNRDLLATRNKMSKEQPKNSNGLPEAFGPQKQGQFLASMGAVERTLKLMEDDKTTDEQAEELCTALERLVSEDEMGERFKVLSIAHKKDGIFPPPGF